MSDEHTRRLALQHGRSMRLVFSGDRIEFELFVGSERYRLSLRTETPVNLGEFYRAGLPVRSLGDADVISLVVPDGDSYEHRRCALLKTACGCSRLIEVGDWRVVRGGLPREEIHIPIAAPYPFLDEPPESVPNPEVRVFRLARPMLGPRAEYLEVVP